MTRSHLLALALLAGVAVADAGQTTQSSLPLVRRVVTGNNGASRSFVVSDTRVPVAGTTPNIFRTNGEAPLGVGIAGDTRVLPFQELDIDLGAGGTGLRWEVPPTPPAAKPFWHRTATVDYVMVVTGEMVLSFVSQSRAKGQKCSNITT